MAKTYRQMQGRFTLGIGAIGIGTAADQEVEDVSVGDPLRHQIHQCGLGVQLYPLIQQQLGHLGLAVGEG